jgi:hypothetical protein
LVSDPWYIYVRKDTLQIYRSSPSLEADDECHIIEIEKELGVSFVHAPHTMDQFIVYYDGEKAHFIKKEEANEKVIQFFFTPVLIKEIEDEADLSIVVRDREFDVVLKKELTTYVMCLYPAVDQDKRIVELYISSKNDPNKLIEVVRINMVQLVNEKNTLTFPFNYKIEDVSFFTRKAFDSYGLVIENKDIIK